MKYVLDTNAVSALMKGQESVVAKLRAVQSADVALPQPVIAELAYGIERLPRSKRRTALREQLDLICAELGRASWNDDVSERFGFVKAALERKGERIEDFDVAIAAHALSEGAVLVTANVEHMARVPNLKVEDWGA
jgi:tRNA(fMet)-specific endonuclease VapC